MIRERSHYNIQTFAGFFPHIDMAFCKDLLKILVAFFLTVWFNLLAFK